MGKLRTTEEGVSKAIAVHSDRYDYSKAIYSGDANKICVICREHGEFWQTPSSHLHGCGCPMCVGLKKLTTEEFIKRSIEVHGNRYNYSKVEYNGKRKKVTIICPIHGEFQQLPKNHYNGQGCPICGKEYAKEYRKHNYTNFIAESKCRFGDNYEFPKIEDEYENSHSAITIKCRKCGSVFTKMACDHLTSENGGCLKCLPKLHGYSEAEFEIINCNDIHVGPEILLILLYF